MSIYVTPGSEKLIPGYLSFILLIHPPLLILFVVFFVCNYFVHVREVAHACMIFVFTFKKLNLKLMPIAVLLNFDCGHASDYGLMKIDNTGRIVQFDEKPKGPDLKAMVVKFISLCCKHLLYPSLCLILVLILPLQQVDNTLLGLSMTDAVKYPYIASMGVYVFRADVLLQL